MMTGRRDLPAGLGWMIWELEHFDYSVKTIVDACHRSGATWVAIKLTNGLLYKNREKGLAFLVDVIAALRSEGIKVVGWSYNFTKDYISMSGQTYRINDCIERFQLDDGWILDIEEHTKLGAHWKTGTASVKRQSAQELVDGIDMPVGYSLSLCSYRFPSVHPDLPWDVFFNNPKVNIVSPQVYWVHASNSAEQTIASHGEYSNKAPGKTFSPMMAAYGETVGGKFWEPDIDEITSAISAARSLGADSYSLWSLDYSHRKPAWLDAIGDLIGTDVPPPPPPPPPPVEDNQLCIPVGKWAELAHEELALGIPQPWCNEGKRMRVSGRSGVNLRSQPAGNVVKTVPVNNILYIDPNASVQAKLDGRTYTWTFVSTPAPQGWVATSLLTPV